MIFLNEKNSTLVIPWLILFSLAFYYPFKDLDIDYINLETTDKQGANALLLALRNNHLSMKLLKF